MFFEGSHVLMREALVLTFLIISIYCGNVCFLVNRLLMYGERGSNLQAALIELFVSYL